MSLPPRSEAALPDTLRAAVGLELRAVFRPPFKTLIGVGVNALLVLILWFGVPRSWFFHFQGGLALPMILSSWMLADVTATNVLAPDRLLVLGGLVRDTAGLRRLIEAKNIALWLLVAPICALLAVVIGQYEQQWVATFVTLVMITIVPAALLGWAALVGVRYPYHPRPLRWRWRHRARYRTVILRWAALVLSPYLVLPGLGLLLAAPSILAWGLMTDWRFRELSDLRFAIGAVPVCVLGVAAGISAHHVTGALLQRRIMPLSAYLGDPERG